MRSADSRIGYFVAHTMVTALGLAVLSLPKTILFQATEITALCD